MGSCRTMVGTSQVNYLYDKLQLDVVGYNKNNCGGERGIRTPGTHKRTIDFESTALDHSATSPLADGNT